MKKNILLLVIIASAIISFSGCKSESSDKNIITLTTDNFSKETAKGIVLVDFWATWCMPCKAMAPVIEEIAGQTQGKVKVGKVDIDENGSLANQFSVQSIPSILIFKDGQLMETFVGVQSKATLVNALSKYVALE
ncbi:MAG: thioredoxin [Bacteroidales bacterium]